MLDFFPKHRRASPLGSGQQLRLLTLVVLLALVLMALSEAGNPQRWTWLTGDAAASMPRSDNRTLGQPLVAAPTAGDLALPGLADDTLEAVRDDAPFRAVEEAAMFRVFDLLRSSPEAAAALELAPRAMYNQLAHQPASYRGQVIRVEGQLHGAFRQPAPANDLGISHFYQLWIEPPDRSFPVVVYCLTLPHDMPLGDQLSERVSVAGVSFKRWPYLAKDGLRTAPVVLAASLDWLPDAPSDTGPARMLPPWSLLLTAALIAGAVVAWAASTRSVRPAGPARRRFVLPSQARPGRGSSAEADVPADPAQVAAAMAAAQQQPMDRPPPNIAPPGAPGSIGPT